MNDYNFLLILAIILISTKLFSLASTRIHMPQVLGALIAGVILGPSCLNMVGDSELLSVTSEMGVILLMFLAGLDTDLKQLKQTGIASFFVALVGVIVPLGGGYILYRVYFPEDADPMKALFIGVILTATSVSITVETLRELGKLNSKVGTTIVGAAVIDDILGIIVLTVASSLSGDGGKGQLWIALGKIALFFVFLAVFGTLVHFLFVWLTKRCGTKRRISIFALVFCLLTSYCAITFFGVADIAGAYFAGLFLCNITKTRQYVAGKLNVASYLIFSPVFFASIGIKTDLRGMTPSLLLFSFVFLIAAILTKVIGCGLPARFFKFNRKDSLTIGVGMVNRGEVCLIVAQIGSKMGLVSPRLFPCIILVVVLTTLLTPILLKFMFHGSGKKKPAMAGGPSPDELTDGVRLHATEEESTKIDENHDAVDFNIKE